MDTATASSRRTFLRRVAVAGGAGAAGAAIASPVRAHPSAHHARQFTLDVAILTETFVMT